jgi:hypothetical protein
MHTLDPLLSLTVSATLRDRPLDMTPARQVLASLIEAAGGLPSTTAPKSPIKPSEGQGESVNKTSGLEEVNLLGALATGMLTLMHPNDMLISCFT